MLVIFVLSSALGVMAFRRYRSSERYIDRSMGELEGKAKALDVEGCVDWILDWHKRCEAMAGLCQAAVTRLMGICLRAQDRRAYCQGLHRSTTSTDFGYAECKARGVKRHRKKACAGLYRVIDSHCHLLEKKKSATTAAAKSAGGAR